MLSERFSSRPMGGWSQSGADSLSQARVFVLQGGDVFAKLEQHDREQHKRIAGIRVDKRSWRRFQTNTAQYAESFAAHFVTASTGRHRSWQHGITHNLD